MTTIFSPQTLHPKHGSRWITALFLVLCALPALYFGLLFTTVDQHSLYTMAVHALRPLITIVAIGILLSAAWRDQGHRRWAWIFLSLSMMSGVIFNSIRIVAGPSLATPFLQMFVVVIYVAALIGASLYLQKRVWSVGSTWRVVVGGVTVGIAALILMRACLPLVITPWFDDSQVNAILAYLAFDIGILFALSVIALRHKRGSSPFLPLVLLCIVCLFFADALTLSARLYDWQRYWAWPFYTLHHVLLAIAAYRDAIHPRPAANTTPTLMPLVEWLLWTQIPFLFVVAAFAAASFSGASLHMLLILLILAAIAYETLAVFDYRRVWCALYAANRQLAAYATAAEERATLEERNRLAREIHDGLGHYLTKINMQLNAAASLMPVDQDGAGHSLGKAQILAQEALTDVRRSVEALRSGPIEYRPLVEALGDLVEESNAAGITTNLDVIGTLRPLSALTELTFYRIMQEGLTNVRKHAHANNVDIELTYGDTIIRLLICDDGRGAADTTQGFGLLGMRERVQQLGGTMQMYTAPHQGFTLKIEVPA